MKYIFTCQAFQAIYVVAQFFSDGYVVAQSVYIYIAYYVYVVRKLKKPPTLCWIDFWGAGKEKAIKSDDDEDEEYCCPM